MLTGNSALQLICQHGPYHAAMKCGILVQTTMSTIFVHSVECGYIASILSTGEQTAKEVIYFFG